MIKPESLSAEWVAEKRKKFRKDPTIMEGFIHSLYLLERLKLTGLDFIFKGGTSLVLLMDQPKRFSVDIDIIVSPLVNKEKLEEYLSGIVGSSAFIRMELDEMRSYKAGIPKAHYKFIYNSNFAGKNKEGNVIANPVREILLDVVFAENHYPALVEKQIQTEWLVQEGEPLDVKIPDINSIAGDKMTAFAPNTTGVPYGAGKEKEIMKQLYDVGCLFDLLTDIESLKRSFYNSAKAEIEYRPERKIGSVEQVLRDIIDTSLLIARIVRLSNDEKKVELREINSGINQFKYYVFEGSFSFLDAQVASSKATYLAAVILTDYKGELQKFNPSVPVSEFLITHAQFNFLNKRLKFIARGEALFYWFHAIRLLYPENK
jgi:hypothetical protein